MAQRGTKNTEYRPIEPFSSLSCFVCRVLQSALQINLLLGSKDADMATTEENPVPVGSIWNVPNMVTLARIALSIGCFICMAVGWYRAALVLFVIAAGTDWVDGWWARRYNQITQIGRVLDPLADKLLICGIFVFLAAVPGSRIVAWMAVVVLARELMVTVLRSFVEARGGDFSAKWLGKLKMVWQCVAAALSLLLISSWNGIFGEQVMARPPLLVDIAVWGSLLFTIWSGVTYVTAAAATLGESEND